MTSSRTTMSIYIAARIRVKKPPGLLEQFYRPDSTVSCRVFDETLFRIFAKHETRENAPVFRETFANFASFARSNFRDFRVSRKL